MRPARRLLGSRRFRRFYRVKVNTTPHSELPAEEDHVYGEAGRRN